MHVDDMHRCCDFVDQNDGADASEMFLHVLRHDDKVVLADRRQL